jgi:hypothetical protein
MKLDKTTVASLALPKGKNELFVWDDDLPGFGVRLRGNSTRYIVQYRAGVQQRRESLGDIRKITIEAAAKSLASASPRSSWAPIQWRKKSRREPRQRR